MPHLVILYTPNLDPDAGMTALCRKLADAMLQVRDETGQQVFPSGGTRVLAYPAAHYAVADGQGDYGFVYMNLHGQAQRRAHLAPLFERAPLGLTVQVDESPGQVYDGKHSTLHPLFNRS
ncbi:MAG: 5-carboxymethyl-2-hydroxymuconate isomerase [Ramlibacter sp.]